MSIQLPNDDESSEMSEINVTPLVDVMLVLLVVFIVTTPLLTQVVRSQATENRANRTGARTNMLPFSASMPKANRNSTINRYHWPPWKPN